MDFRGIFQIEFNFGISFFPIMHLAVIHLFVVKTYMGFYFSSLVNILCAAVGATAPATAYGGRLYSHCLYLLFPIRCLIASYAYVCVPWLKCKRNFVGKAMCVCCDFERALNTFANIHFRADIKAVSNTVLCQHQQPNAELTLRVKKPPPLPSPPWHLPCENILEVFTFRGHTYHT